MAPSKVPEQTPAERRKGESALSDFAAYVAKEQTKRQAPIRQPVVNGKKAPVVIEDHAELDILDTLDLADTTTAIRLKQVLTDRTDNAIEDNEKQLSTWISTRLEDANGEMLMDLGLEDNGDAMGFTKEDWDFALKRVEEVAGKLGADCSIQMTRNVGGDVEVGPAQGVKDSTACSGKLMIRRRPKNVDDVIETRIAVVGNVDAGKSTMLGVLVKGGLDDGRGKARVNLFRHKHEVESGRTSSVGMEIMGFDTKGHVVASAVPGRKLSWEEIGKQSVCACGILTCHRSITDTNLLGQSDQFHRFGGPRAISTNHSLWSSQLRA